MTGVEENLVVALIGSARHLVGHQEPSPELGRVGHSWLPSLHRLLENALADADAGNAPAVDEQGTLRDVVAFSGRVAGPATSCEFLARQLMRGTVVDRDGRSRNVVIATPLYVAMSDEIPGA
jgi:hypothetical protein